MFPSFFSQELRDLASRHPNLVLVKLGRYALPLLFVSTSHSGFVSPPLAATRLYICLHLFRAARRLAPSAAAPEGPASPTPSHPVGPSCSRSCHSPSGDSPSGDCHSSSLPPRGCLQNPGRVLELPEAGHPTLLRRLFGVCGCWGALGWVHSTIWCPQMEKTV